MAGMREEGREQRKTVGQEGVGVDRGGAGGGRWRDQRLSEIEVEPADENGLRDLRWPGSPSQ